MTNISTKPLNHAPAFDALCDDAKTRITEMTVDQVEQLLKEKDDVLLIDVRDADEFEKFRIEGAKHMSKGWIEAKIHTVTDSATDTIVLYCGGGNRSALAADNLQKMGYRNVYSMAGGIKGWINAGKAVDED